MKKALIALLILNFLVPLKGNIRMQTNNKEVLDSTVPVHKKVLANGLTVLVRPIHTVPKVSIQLWYNVGSKDEKDNERGIAHLIEHMIFKGTDRLSEADIDTISHKLSGYLNAFTSYDYTGYLFNFPSQHWQQSFDIMADCMQNCTFKDYMLNSEMKAVIQELKMYRDRYDRSLVDEMISSIFHDHPYHHPIIGYKQDLWSVDSNDLKSFYKKHYMPNNATLVVVGNVDPHEVFAEAEKSFGSIPANPDYKKDTFYFNKDIVSKTTTMYRDVKQPLAVYSFVVPGTRSKKDNVLELLARIIGSGKSSRLYKRLVDEEQLAVSLSASNEDLFDHGLFFIVVQPHREQDLAKIEAIIIEELDRIKRDGFDDVEFTRALKKTESSILSLMENFEHQAYEIGKYYLATGDENYLFTYMNQPHDEMKKEMNDILKTYFRPSVMHKGFVLTIPEQEKDAWAQLQKESDALDAEILSARVRNEPIEEPRYAKEIQAKDPGRFDYPKATVHTLKNGLKVLSYHNDNIPKVDLILDLKTKHYSDPDDKQGLALFVSKMLLEGTKNYTSQELNDAIESRGMSIATYPGGIALSVLREDLEFGLSVLNEILTNATFNEKEIEKVRAQLRSKLQNFWDEPRYFAGQLVKEKIYKNHPYSKISMGTLDAINAINQADLKEYYKQYVSPSGARLAIVGDLHGNDVAQLIEKGLGNWTGPEIEELSFPDLKEVSAEIIDHPINRDQVVLRFAGLGVNRFDPDFDKLLLFDQIFGGGALGGMHSRLFKLREQSGLFYAIGGSLIAGADEQPGMMLVQTIVSLDRLSEAENAIKQTIANAADAITDEEFQEAKLAVINSQVDNFASNYNIANALLFVDRYKFPADFFDTRAQKFAQISAKESAEAAKKLLNRNLLTLRVGRVSDDTTTA
jgi:zinc protease